jgi:hypothetical protein
MWSTRLASNDHSASGHDLPRSLSEQLRILEQQLNRLSDSGPVQLVHPTRQPYGVPTSLGRQIGLAPPVLGVPERFPGEDGAEDVDQPSRSTFRRSASVAACSLLLLSGTAIVPSIWHLAAPVAEMTAASLPTPATAKPVEAALRTEQFAHAARELAQAGLLIRAASVIDAPAASVQQAPVAAPPPPPDTREGRTPAVTSPVTRLTVAESDLQRLSLPMLVSGGGPSWAGSAVIIDGLPAEARVSHGLKIAPDTWTVGIADVGHAVLSLPPTTPDHLELSVRVLAANSRELAASALEIHVLRTPDAPAPIAPAAIFEPASADTAGGPDIGPAPVTRQAVKVERSRRPATPPKPPVTREAKQQDRPTASSAWLSTVLPPAPPPAAASKQSWSPFNN